MICRKEPIGVSCGKPVWRNDLVSNQILNGVGGEQERLRLVTELSADAGEKWADAYQPGTSGCHELLDRTALIVDLLERQLLTHPACVARPEWYTLADRAATALRELYQAVGSEHLSAE